jgi:hypothetical protein
MALAPYKFQSGEPIFYFLSKQPEEIIEPSVERLPELFGLIKAIVEDNGETPFGNSCEDEKRKYPLQKRESIGIKALPKD